MVGVGENKTEQTEFELNNSSKNHNILWNLRLPYYKRENIFDNRANGIFRVGKI